MTIIKQKEVNKKHQIEDAHTSFIRDISWSFDVSKNYYQVATSGEEKTCKIWKLDEECRQIDSQNISKENSIWKISWNFMGNLLAVSFANKHKQECVEVYYQNNEGKWVSDSKASS